MPETLASCYEDELQKSRDQDDVISHLDCWIRPFFFFWWNWRLNSSLRICKAGALPLEPHLQYIFALVILDMGFCELFAWAGLKL
jgi:hypothetical protein